MAKAPKPGVSKRAEETSDAQKVLTITLHREVTTAKGRVVPASHTLAPALLPMRERLICRKATGLPFESFWSENAIALDSVVVLWWLARRAHGEVTLTFQQADEQWPTDLEPGDLDIDFEDGEPDEDTGESDPEG